MLLLFTIVQIIFNHKIKVPDPGSRSSPARVTAGLLPGGSVRVRLKTEKGQEVRESPGQSRVADKDQIKPFHINMPTPKTTDCVSAGSTAGLWRTLEQFPGLV